jgi:hypothetical protein
MFTYILILTGLLGCTNSKIIHEEEKQNHDDAKEIYFMNDSLSCDSLLRVIFRSSNYESVFENLDVRIDEIFDNGLILKIVSVEDDNDMAIGWLMFSMENETLEDITSDAENPIPLKFDKEQLAILKKQNCHWVEQYTPR